MVSENTQALPFGEILAHVGRRRFRLQAQGVTAQIHCFAAAGIERMVKLRREVARADRGHRARMRSRRRVAARQSACARTGRTLARRRHHGAAHRAGAVLDAREESLERPAAAASRCHGCAAVRDTDDGRSARSTRKIRRAPRRRDAAPPRCRPCPRRAAANAGSRRAGGTPRPRGSARRPCVPAWMVCSTMSPSS